MSVAVLVSHNLPIWEHGILNVQSFPPRFKPAYVPSHLTPEFLGVVPGCGEGSAVRGVGRILPAALRGEVLLDTCRRMRSSCTFASLLLLLCCCTESPQFPPECPLPLNMSAVTQAHQVFYLEVHRCRFQKLNFHAFLLLPVCLVAGESQLPRSNASRRHAGAAQRQRRNLHKALKECEL